MSHERLMELQKRQRARRNGQLFRWMREQARLDAEYAARRDEIRAWEAARIADLASEPVTDPELAAMLREWDERKPATDGK